MRMNKNKSPLRLVTSSFHPAIAASAQAPAMAATHEHYRRAKNFTRDSRGNAETRSMLGLLDEVLGKTRALDIDEARVAPLRLAHAQRQIEALKKELAELRGLVHVDHLTGTLNRSGLDQAYLREAARADRQAAPLGTALLDIDNFKTLNDTHGHQAGDAALMHFAAVIRRTLRPSDTVVRFGGEEFLFLLPDSSPQQTARALARLRADLGRSPLVYMKRKLPLTFSAGIAVRKPGESCDALVSRADRALYKAKGAGKNRNMTAD